MRVFFESRNLKYDCHPDMHGITALSMGFPDADPEIIKVEGISGT